MPRDTTELSLDAFSRMPGAEEFHLIQKTQNPPIPDDTAYIWILSSRHTILGECINCPKNPAMYIISQTDPEAMECDTYDDFVRIEAALEIAQMLTCKRAKKEIRELTLADYKQHAPYIIYNGLDEQNTALTNVLAENGLKRLSLPYLPPSKFIIFGLPKELRHTGGQFHTLAILLKDQRTKKFDEQDARLIELSKENVSVTIVTAGYHLFRTRRYLNSRKFENPLSHANVTFFMADRGFERPCVKRDCKTEMEKFESYALQGFIGEPDSLSNWYHIESLKSWAPLRASEYRKKNHNLKRLEALDLAELTTPRYKKLSKS